MTREEAIYCLKSYQPDAPDDMCQKCKYYKSVKLAPNIYTCISSKARDMAIQALSQEPCVTESQMDEYIKNENPKLILSSVDENEYKDVLKEPCDDAVSREEAINTAIDAVDDWDGGTNMRRTEIITNAMKQLPSVNPQYTGNEFFNFSAPIVKKSMEQDAISREMALKECHDIVVDGERYRVIQEETLLGLPFVTQKPIECGDTVSREDALKLIYDFKEKHTEDREKHPINYGTLLDLIRLIRELPPVTPICEERKKGECPYYAG